jgi:hypothetical protein
MVIPVTTSEFGTKERDKSVRARESTRLAIRFPILICAVDPPGAAERVSGWSVAVSNHGCKIEGKGPLPVGRVADVTVVSTRKTGRGRVVWADPSPNTNGNYELAIQFDEPCNIWGLRFPPEDWEVEKKDRTVNPQGTLAKEITLDTSVVTASPTQTVLPEPQEAAAAANGSAAIPNVLASPPQEIAEAHPEEPAYAADLETLDLTAMISDLANNRGDSISPEQAPVASLPQSFGSEIPAASDSPQVITERSGTPLQSPVLAQPLDAESTPPSTHSEISPVPTADPVTPPPGLGGSLSIPTSPANRLADAVRDLIQSTLSAEQGVAAERLIKALEDRMARMQLEVLDRVTHQIQSLVSAQTSVLKERADEFAGQSQQVLSIHLKQLAEAADQNARAAQSDAASTVERALSHLHDEVAEQLPQTEKKFLDECRTLAGQSVSVIVEDSLRTMSLRIAEANRGLEETAERTQKVLLDTSLQLEQQAVTKIDETTKYLEAQLRVVAQRIFSSFQQYTVAELGKKQRTMEVEFQQQMQAVSESSLFEMQGALSRMLEGLAETMRPTPSRGVSDSNSPKGEPTLSASPVCQTKSAGGGS